MTGPAAAPQPPEDRGRCGAGRGWLGLEPEPDCLAWARGEEPCSRCYVCHTRTVLRLLRRVLRKDGVLFLDLDDTRTSGSSGHAGRSMLDGGHPQGGRRVQPARSIPAKNLALIPDSVRLAARADGWIIRQKNIIPTWMPESAKDRPTKAYREVIMMTRSPRYWYDAQAVRQPAARSGTDWGSGHGAASLTHHFAHAVDQREDWQRSAERNDGQRNLGSIWTLPPSSSALPGSHFAAFPLEEPLLCLRAACPKYVCSDCGIPLVVGSQSTPRLAGDGRPSLLDLHLSCPKCGSTNLIPGLVLDPFCGTGTSLVAARKLGRRAIGIEASPEFVAGTIERLRRGDDGLRTAHEQRKQGAEQAMLL